MLERLRRPATAWWLGAIVAVVAAALIVQVVDRQALLRAARALAAEPLLAAGVVGAYLLAFVARAVAWQRILPRLSPGHALAGIHLALGGNHVLPARLGEALRVTSVVRRAGVRLPTAAASTVTLRAADLVALALLASAAGAQVLATLIGAWRFLLLAGAIGALAIGVLWLRRIVRRGERDLRLPDPAVALLVVVAWALEAVVVWAAARWVGVALSPSEALLVTTITVAAQTVAIAPGGFGTYEAAGTAVLVALGLDASTGLAVALTAHAVKTAYSLVAGAVALWVPSPGLLGRVRLPDRSRTASARRSAAEADAPVVLFLPAHDEEGRVGAVVRRAPSHVLGRRVEVVVVDDGSTDGTAAEAAVAGARVVHHGTNRGLGAAVATGLADAVARGAAAVAFCDADGEYAPEELERLVGPVLAGEAEYVVGSRFGGDIQRMLPHRRLGNLVLTAALRFVARTPISDGQSGYRALSPTAAAASEMAHDYNYAQVLTLDLLAKGFRYVEVPITYRFRQEGRSFVRLGRYLRNVVPAVWRTVNRAPVRPAA